METNLETSDDFTKRDPQEKKPDRIALVAMQQELLAVPREGVQPPLENVDAFVERALCFVASAKSGERMPEAQIARLEMLARALRAAQSRWLFLPIPAKADVGLACFVGGQLFLLVTGVHALVEKGLLAEAELPRAAGSSAADRCRWGVALVAFLQQKKCEPKGLRLKKIAATAATLAPYMAETPYPLLVRELRDRAYCVLRAELAAAQADERVSGEHDIGGLTQHLVPSNDTGFDADADRAIA